MHPAWLITPSPRSVGHLASRLGPHSKFFLSDLFLFFFFSKLLKIEVQTLRLRNKAWLGVVAPAFNPSTWETEAV